MGRTGTRFLVIAALSLAFLSEQAAAQQNPGGPSFDCAKASSPTDKTICSSADLSNLDLQFTALYRQLRNSEHRDRSLDSARDRNREKQKCLSNKECIRTSYIAGISEFQSLLAEASPPQPIRADHERTSGGSVSAVTPQAGRLTDAARNQGSAQNQAPGQPHGRPNQQAGSDVSGLYEYTEIGFGGSMRISLIPACKISPKLGCSAAIDVVRLEIETVDQTNGHDCSLVATEITVARITQGSSMKMSFEAKDEEDAGNNLVLDAIFDGDGSFEIDKDLKGELRVCGLNGYFSGKWRKANSALTREQQMQPLQQLLKKGAPPSGQPSTQQTQPSSKANQLRMSVAELEDAVWENEINLQNRVNAAGGVIVTGRVESVEAIWGAPVLGLRGREEYLPTLVYLEKRDKDRAANLKKGELVSVLCKTTKNMVAATLTDCRFNSPLTPDKLDGPKATGKIDANIDTKANPLRMSVAELEDAVDTNEINLQNRVNAAGGVIVTGRVVSVQSRWSKPVVLLKGQDSLIGHHSSSVSVHLESRDNDRAANLKREELVSVLCKTTKKMSRAALYDCRFN